MSFHQKSLNTYSILIVITVLSIMLLSTSVMAQFPDIEIDVGDTTASPGATNSVISIYMINRADTIAGFNLWLQLDRPDIMIFQTDTVTIVDTSYWICHAYSGPDCIDSQLVLESDDWNLIHINSYLDTIGNFDTTGTLTSGWEMIDSRSISETGYDINIAGIADLPGGSGTTTGIPPSFEGGVLVKILADIYDINDTLTDRTVNILVQSDFKDHFGLSTPDGTSIPWIKEEKPDTSCFRCTQWVIEGNDTLFCANYVEITFGDCDSIYVVMDSIVVLDTANIKIFNGFVTVEMGGVCGNINGEVEPLEIDIADLVYLVEHSFLGGPAPVPMWVANMNCDNEDGDIADLVMMVEYMFLGGTPICPVCD